MIAVSLFVILVTLIRVSPIQFGFLEDVALSCPLSPKLRSLPLSAYCATHDGLADVLSFLVSRKTDR
jgi:hypothetical protein